MTVSSSTSRASYSGNGTLTTFAYSFKVFDQDDLTVILRASNGTETVQTITTDYTVTGVGSVSGGNVVFGTAPASGVTVVILREMDLEQGLDLVPNDPFPAESLEDSLDKLTFMVQQHDEQLGRAIKASRTNVLSGSEFVISAADRANKVFSFDGSGDLAVTQELGTFQGDWATATVYQVRDIVKDTSTNNIFIVNTAHTSSGAQPLTTNANSAKYDLIVDAASATTSATNAAASETAAQTAQTAAEAAQSAAETAQSAAETAETNAETAETNAAASAAAAATSETNAATSATSASGSATTATTKASEASTSATNASTAQTAAETAQTAAETAETNAETAETNAATSETNAATSAATATTQATTATTKASEAAASAAAAATSETNAATSATNAATSETNAANSAAAAATALDNFDDRYLGSKASDPTVDNDGNALVSGALYFNSTANEMRVYDGANWIAASSAGTASLILYEYTATSGQTTFSGTDDNSASLSYSVGNIQVVMNGVVLDPSDFTATSGTSVVLASGAATGDLLNVYAFKSFTVADTVSASAGGTFAGDVTFNGAFTSQGIDDNATSTAMTLDASGNVLVGTTSANTNGITLNSGDYIYASRNGGQALFVNRDTSDGTLIDLRKGGSAVGSIGAASGNTYIGSGDTGIAFSAADDTVYPITTATGGIRDAAIDLGGSTYRYKDLYLSGGVYLGGVGSSNLLDDYEEGTWTPSIAGATGYSHRNGTYTKIGNFVAVYCFVQLTGNSSGGTNLAVSGLPFLSANNSTYGATSGIHCNSWSTTNKPDNGLIAPNYQGIDFYKSSGQTGMAIPLNSDMGTGSLIFSAVYEAA